MNSKFSRTFMPFEPVYSFDINGSLFPMTEVEYYVWMAKATGEVIGQECGLNGKAVLDHELYPLMLEYMKKGHTLCFKQGLTYWEVFDKVTSHFRKVVRNGS